jgi:peptidoglycan hydrolase-like protein with peptidoglycan-binding domain
MTDAATILRQGGNGQPGLGLVDELLAACAVTGHEVASAAALITKETAGRNIWGHDGVDTGGCYDKGGPVTRENYLCVRASRTAGFNGAGPGQLTWVGYWTAADALGGVWDPRANLRVALKALTDLQRQYGDQDGARAYNGTNAAARAYGADYIARRLAWRVLLAGTAAPMPSSPPPAPAVGRPTLGEGVTSELVWQLQQFLNRVFPAYSHIDAGPGPTSRLGPQTIGVVEEFQRRSGIPTAPPFSIGPRTWAALASAGFR